MSIVCSHYTKYRLGETDIHIQKWIFSGTLRHGEDKTKLDLFKHVKEPSIRIAYSRSIYGNCELYFDYPETCNIEIMTMKSNCMDKQLLTVIEHKQYGHVNFWKKFAKFADSDVHAGLTVSIQFDITNIKDKVENKLANDWKYLFKEALFSDATVESCDSVPFKVHKCVLSCRSAVFKAHFDHDSTESQTGIIKSTFDGGVLKEVFNYIYSGVEAVDFDIAPDNLFIASDFYQLTELKDSCEHVLYKKLTVNNVINTIKLADLHSAPTLKKLAKDFFIRHAPIIFTSPEWTELQSIDMLKDIFEQSINDYN